MFDGFFQPTHVILLVMLGVFGYLAFVIVRIVYRVGKRVR